MAPEEGGPVKYKLNLENSCFDFLELLDKKQFKQVVVKILKLLVDPYPPDSKKLEGAQGGRRADQGEYRILYVVDEGRKEIQVWRIGKRNSDEVCRNL